jgi:hypothetical protein
VTGTSAGGILLGLFAFLLGVAGISVALRRRGRRARNPEAYAMTGGIAYTVVQIGCSGLLLLGGSGLIALAIIFKR